MSEAVANRTVGVRGAFPNKTLGLRLEFSPMYQIHRQAAFIRPSLTSASAFAAAALLFTSSCVTREQFEDSQLTAKHFQNQKIELERRLSDAEDENRRLRAQLEATMNNPVDASFDAQSIDARIASLRNVMAELGAAPGDVTKFEVDGGYVYRVKDSVLFGLGSAEVSADGKRVLAEVVADIQSRPFGKVFVRGHTDDLPIVKPETKSRFPHGNMELSASRAVSVGSLLASNKVPENRIVVMGFGPSEPVAPNSSDENRRKNRRVDIFVQNEQATPAK